MGVAEAADLIRAWGRGCGLFAWPGVAYQIFVPPFTQGRIVRRGCGLM